MHDDGRRCVGVRSAVTGFRPMHVCRRCARYVLDPSLVPLATMIEPAPGRHDGARWQCVELVDKPAR